jgi:hypothetical protein
VDAGGLMAYGVSYPETYRRREATGRVWSVPTTYAPITATLRSALVLLEALEREAAVTPRRARGHGHRDEGRLRDLRV